DLDAEHKKQTTNDAIQIAQQSALQEATAKLGTLQSELERERETRAVKSDAGELIAARNLHIVDVFDTEANGQRQRPFGRVFYVEGHSLVFYAYDLAGPKPRLVQQPRDARVVFHVWGETAGVKATSYNLGILHTDDASQTRW